ncbi:MAG: hypothetical protein RBT11_06935 [Desulfobacterales bacterium]|nr:hypothetical protein [Desulfobacterales bacterium]
MRKVAAAVLALWFVLMGCLNNRITKNYGFTSHETAVDQKDMAVGAKLIGALTVGEKEGWYEIGHRNSPYTLIIYVIARTGYYKSAGVMDIRLKDKHARDFILPGAATHLAVAPFEEVQALYQAEMTLPDLDLPHEKISLEAVIEITTRANSTFRETVHFQFEPIYSEEKSKDF